ncbi:hypothetical protein KUCAC02_026429, partial [Chaenocephalus aceratus]
SVYGVLVVLFGWAPHSLCFFEYLEWVLYEKAYLKKDLRDPRLSPTAAQLWPLSFDPPTLQPFTKALISQQKCVQQHQQLLYSCNESSLSGSQGNVT